MALDSASFFKDRAVQVGLPPAAVESLELQGWTSMARFAFACPAAPGTGDDAIFRRDVVQPVLGMAPQPGALANLRRLFFEAYTLVASDMKTRVERTDEDPPRKLPRVERQDRLTALQQRLPGSRLSDEREPAPALIDSFNQMSEDGVLKYVPWNRCVSARLESLEGGPPCARQGPANRQSSAPRTC